jgi:beta-phosphoglucomutase-like phosphatase (HAD superfamily)
MRIMIDLEALPADIKATIFDCDGTLLDTSPVYTQAWAAGLRSSGREMDPEWYRVRIGMSENVLMDAFEAENGVQLDRENVVAIMRAAFLEEVMHVREIELMADVARRNQHHLPMAIASGGPAAIVVPSLEAAALLHLFDAVVTFDDVGRPKPEPDIFLEAARRLSVEPAGCLVFEDSREGLEAARRAGMRSVDVVAILQDGAAAKQKPRQIIRAVYKGGRQSE